MCVYLCLFSAETYTTSSDLIDALLAYTSTTGDVTATNSDVTARHGDVTDERESNGRRRVTSPRQHVGCDVTDDVTTVKQQGERVQLMCSSGHVFDAAWRNTSHYPTLFSMFVVHASDLRRCSLV